MAKCQFSGYPEPTAMEAAQRRLQELSGKQDPDSRTEYLALLAQVDPDKVLQGVALDRLESFKC